MKKRFLSLMLALAMIVGVFTPLIASAAEEKVSTDKNAKTKTVTLHKLMMDKEVLKAWDSDKVEKSEKADGTKDGYDATQNLEELKQITELKKIMGQKEIKEADGVYFAWQREFEEDDPASTTNPKAKIKVWRYIDKDGNKATVQNPEDANFKTAVLGGLTANKEGYKFTTESLPNGAYKIQEIKKLSTYKNDGNVIVDQKAVPVEITLPLVNNDGVVENAHVYPKNTEDKPEIDKNFKKDNGLKEVVKEGTDKAADSTDPANKDSDPKPSNINDGARYENKDKNKARATVSVGDVVPYEVKTKIAAETSYEKLVWNDIMTNGLTYNKDLNVSIEGITLVYPGDKNAQEEDAKKPDYTLIQDDNGFRLQFTEKGLKKIESVTKTHEVEDKGNKTTVEGKDVEITLTYSATVNGTAKVDNPEKNNVTLEYGHKPGKDLEEKTVNPKDGELIVSKSFKDGKNDANTDGLRLVYTLTKAGANNTREVVASVALDNTIKNTTIDLGNGIKFVVGETVFNGKFTGLPEGQDYKISERVAGFNPAYAETNAAGEVTIVNNKDNDNPTPLEPTTPEVVVGGKKFVKTDDKADNPERLMDARFVVKRENGGKTEYLTYKKDETATTDQLALETAKTNYLKAFDEYNSELKKNGVTEENVKINVPNLDPETLELKAEKTKDVTGKENILKEITVLRRAYEKAFKTAGTFYEWKEKGTLEKVENIKNIVVLSSDAQGRFEIQGLSYGDYKLEEIKTPEGFATIDDVGFTVAKGSYDGKNAEGTGAAKDHIQYNKEDLEGNYGLQVINKKVTIPQTGGIGTIIFTAIGLAIMASAIIAIKKRQATEAR